MSKLNFAASTTAEARITRISSFMVHLYSVTRYLWVITALFQPPAKMVTVRLKNYVQLWYI